MSYMALSSNCITYKFKFGKFSYGYYSGTIDEFLVYYFLNLADLSSTGYNYLLKVSLVNFFKFCCCFFVRGDGELLV